MEKTYKRVPFDIELAKKIQAGEVKGRVTINPFADFTIELPEETPKHELVAEDDVRFFTVENDRISKMKTIRNQKHEFKPFDKVLVRDGNTEPWSARLYDNKRCQWHFCQDGHGWNEAIPYEGNEHLVGTTNKPE